MASLLIERDTLVEILKKNREAHRGIFEEALEGYREHAVKWLNERLDDIKYGRIPKLYFHGAVPEDHTKDYDRVIRMFEMTAETQIRLEEREYSQYVEDNWSWDERFLNSTAGYSKVAAANYTRKYSNND